MQRIDPDYPIWHPFSQMKSTVELPKISRAEGVWLHTADDRQIFDAISSWWVNLHGHAHPHIAARVSEQLKTLEHVIFAGFTHDPAIELCERLKPHLPQVPYKFFFSDNGSTAIEVALKLAVQYLRIGDLQRKVRIIALEGSYHGDTFGAMAAAERSVFTDPWDDMFFDVVHIPAPVPGSESAAFAALEEALTDDCVFIYEPLVQGAGGMRMYSAKALDGLLQRAKAAGALLVADEVMTGFGRLGEWFASNTSRVAPDMICLSKGLTGGALPMALTVCGMHLYDAFLDDKFEKGFLHGHSFTGNPLGCAAALASLDLMEDPATWQQIEAIQTYYQSQLSRLEAHPRLKNVRTIGTILAFDVQEENQGYIHPLRDRLYEGFMKKGLLLRPLGNVVYFLPPYITEIELLERALNDALEVIESV